MQIIYTKSYNLSLKKLKKHHKEYENLLKIIDIVANTNDFYILSNDNYIKVKFKFERLKYNNNEYYSVNLNKNSGMIRLIIKPVNEYIIELTFISYKHYQDFDKGRVIYYDE